MVSVSTGAGPAKALKMSREDFMLLEIILYGNSQRLVGSL